LKPLSKSLKFATYKSEQLYVSRYKPYTSRLISHISAEMRQLIISIILLSLMFTACRNSGTGNTEEIIIFHAGSLSVPLRQLKDIYEKRNPGVKILLEPAGSLVCARKITELKKPCDILASADYFVINKLLIPEYADWSIRFATNEIVIAYNEKAKYSTEINSVNWMDVLLRDDVFYGRSDPDADPCGYRSVLTMMLAESYYMLPGLTGRMTSKNRDFMRPKEVDLVALIESNAIDYMFQYKSVAIQHNLRYIELPDDINLSDPSKVDLYKTVYLDIRGNKPDEKIRVQGEYINYSMTIPFNAVNRDGAVDFMCFILSDEGTSIFRRNGQNPIIPFSTEQPEKIPAKLLIYLPENRTK
jgi:molybdate/tungstate transport system substrate-binding protein